MRARIKRYVDCLAVTNQFSIVTDTRFLEFSAVLSTLLQARCQLRPKHPTTKETIDKIPETTPFTLASIVATAAGTGTTDIDSITTDTIDFNETLSTFAIKNKALIIYCQNM